MDTRLCHGPASLEATGHFVANLAAWGFTLLALFGLPRTQNCYAGQNVTINTWDNLQVRVNQYPEGTTFLITAGIHRLQSVVPKSYDTFVAEPGAVLNGAALLKSFTRSGSYWVSHAFVTPSNAPAPGVCDSAHPACALPEDLFVDNIPQHRVKSLAQVVYGAWYLDYSTGKIYMGEDPHDHVVEISLLPFAFSGWAQSVTINGLIIEKYASPAQSGAVGPKGLYWNIEQNEIRYNHGMGLRTSDGIWVHQNQFHHNGQLGLGGGGQNVVVQSNQIYHNNYAGYDFGWEAGGAKFAVCTNLKVQYNYSHDNNGPGLWCDVGCNGVLFDSNATSGNKEAGILFEISYNGKIQYNYMWDDGFNPRGPSLWWGAGILVSNSPNVEVYGNTVINCMNGIGGLQANRGTGPEGPYNLEGLNVHDNTVTQTTGTAAGILKSSGFDDSVYTSWNNHFQFNTFILAYPQNFYFYWLDRNWTLETWDNNTSLH